MDDTPPPGSDEALDQGCKCPVLDNGHGDGRFGNGEQFVYVMGCPVHEDEDPWQ